MASRHRTPTRRTCEPFSPGPDDDGLICVVNARTGRLVWPPSLAVNISQRGINAIKALEGICLTAYPDPATGGDPWTIGHGHTQGVKQGQTITAEQAEDFLREDLYWVEQCIRDTVRVPLNQEQYDALCSLIFNIGAGAFSHSTLLRKLNDGDYTNAAAEFMRWDMAAGKRMPGLTKRREAEMALFSAGPNRDQAPVKHPSSKPEPITSFPAGEAGPPEQPMPLPAIVGALLPSLIESIPKLGKLFGSGSAVAERNVKAAELAMEIAKEAVGAVNTQEAVEKIKADPAAAAAATAAVESRWFELAESGGGGIDGARKADAAFAAGGGDIKHSPSFWVTMALLPLVYMIVGSVVGWWGKEWPNDVRASLATAIVSLIIGGAAGYYWGQTTSRNRSPAP